MKKHKTLFRILLSLIIISSLGIVIGIGIHIGTEGSLLEIVTGNYSNEAKYIEPTQLTIGTRFLVPDGFTRTTANEYGEYIRALPLLPDKSPVFLYTGAKSLNQFSHVAVIDMDVGEKDLQQCADAALRIRCEYLFYTKQFDKIKYHLTNGDLFSYTDYRDGYRLKLDGNETSLVKTAEYSDTYETFRGYLEILFIYAGTISVQQESPLIPKEEMQIGDIFVIGGSPGHCIIVVDLCENQNGEKMFLLAQSNIPAQQIHLLKNGNSASPWYSLSELDYPFKLSMYTFQEPCLRRMP